MNDMRVEKKDFSYAIRYICADKAHLDSCFFSNSTLNNGVKISISKYFSDGKALKFKFDSEGCVVPDNLSNIRLYFFSGSNNTISCVVIPYVKFDGFTYNYDKPFGRWQGLSLVYNFIKNKNTNTIMFSSKEIVHNE